MRVSVVTASVEMGECFLCFTPSDTQCSSCESVYYCCDDHLSSHVYQDTCLPFSVDTCAGVGRIVRAVRDIKAGELILSESAIVSGRQMPNDHKIIILPLKQIEI